MSEETGENVTKQINFYLPPVEAIEMRKAWSALAEQLVTKKEAGQRGTKRSKLFQLICEAAMKDQEGTIQLLKEIKRIAYRFDENEI